MFVRKIMAGHTALSLVLFLLMGVLSGCNNTDEGVSSEDADDGRMSIVSTIFPGYDWAGEILGDLDSYNLFLLIDDGVDMHSYEPTVQDVLKVSSCDIFIYVGGESDGWVKDAIEESVNPNQKTICLLDVLGEDAKEEETVEGMQEDGEDDEEPQMDEHVWLSLKNAQVFVSEIESAIEEKDPSNKDKYEQNTENYLTKLNALDKKYSDAAENSPGDTLLFADRFPFRYLVDDYGIKYYAAFDGCSAETEASFETIIFLAKKIDELGLGSILTIEGDDKEMAETVLENTQGRDIKILEMDSLQSITSKDLENGESYLGIMEENLCVINEALN